MPAKERYIVMGELQNNDAIQLFEDKKIRTAWDEEQEEWYFSIVDVIAVLTDQKTPRSASTYWAVLKKRLKDEGANELRTNCKQLQNSLIIRTGTPIGASAPACIIPLSPVQPSSLFPAYRTIRCLLRFP